jgi:hypothetical protein
LRAKAIAVAIMPAIEAMRTQGVQDTWFLDRLHDQLGLALAALTALTASDVATRGSDRDINTRTLLDLKRLCRLPG